MNHIEAIRKLIERNKSLAFKSGISAYTRESDDIINALLRYVKNVESEHLKLTESNRRMTVLFDLIGLPEKAKNIDSEFLERYLKYDIVPEIWLLSGFNPGDYELHLEDIIRNYESSQKQIQSKYALYLQLKELFKEEKMLFKLENTFPNEVKWFRKQYTEPEIKEEIKRSVYFNLYE